MSINVKEEIMQLRPDMPQPQLEVVARLISNHWEWLGKLEDGIEDLACPATPDKSSHRLVYPDGHVVTA